MSHNYPSRDAPKATAQQKALLSKIIQTVGVVFIVVAILGFAAPSSFSSVLGDDATLTYVFSTVLLACGCFDLFYLPRFLNLKGNRR